MPRPTPFHSRTSALVESYDWQVWSGYVTANAYDLEHTHEYNALRTSATVYDVSPLYKYHVHGPGAVRLLDRVLTRDVTRLRVGQVAYTTWCDDDGKIIDDGAIARIDEGFYRLTAADPTQAWLEDNAVGMDVVVEDVGEAYAGISVQGPTSRALLDRLVPEDLAALKYFRLIRTCVAGLPVFLSRTGYTGDLGYELFVEAHRAERLWDAVMEAGQAYNLRPLGNTALDMARIEAGLLLTDVDFISSRKMMFAVRKSSPLELGLGWTVNLEKPFFVGQAALRREQVSGLKETTVGLELDLPALEALYARFGMPLQLPYSSETESVPIYADENARVRIGKSTSRTWSPVLKKYVGIARVKPPYSRLGARVYVETTIEAHRLTVPATVVKMPFFDPPEKKGLMAENDNHHYDAIIIGAGHNGLTCAAYLARAGKKVLVLEKRHVLGGAAVTEEVFPGFRFSVCSYVVSLLRPEIIRELDLPRFGLHILPLDSAFAPLENGDYLAMYADPASTRAELKRHSARDADAYPEFSKVMYDMAFGVKRILGMTPPDLAAPGIRGLRTLASFGKHLQSRGKPWFHDFTKIMTMSAVDFLDEWFETDIVRALFSLNGIIGTMLGPRSPGTAYVLLHHYMGELDGAFTAWGWQRGGTGMVSEAIAGAARHHGAVIRCSAPVSKVIVKNGQAVGVALETGEEYLAPIVVSGADPYVTFRKLVDEKELPDELVEAIDRFKFRGSSGKVNLALDALPEFTAMKDKSLLRGMMEICPSIDYLERAYDDAKYGGHSQHPYMDILLPSTIDPTIAPPGKHMMSIFVQYASYDLPPHGDRDREREEFGDAVIDTLETFVPNIKDIILHKQVLTPWDIEQKIGMTEGNIFQGELTLDQLFFLRPAPGWADYRTPIRGYYQCGSGTHPGGGITGGPGRLAAMEILRN